MRAAVIYARVSSKDQEREGYSIPAQLKFLREHAHAHNFEVLGEFVDVETLRANIGETSLVPLFNEQGEKEEEGDELSWCSFLGGVGWRGTERRRAKRAAAQWSASQSGRRFRIGFAARSRSGCQTKAANVHRGI